MFKVFFQRRGPGEKNEKNENEAILTATPRRKSLARKQKVPRTGQRTELAFSLKGTFDDFFNYFLFMAAICSGTMNT